MVSAETSDAGDLTLGRQQYRQRSNTDGTDGDGSYI